ncbi:MAG: PDZ domain-containing protein [Candidatus Schekmanbacteria bacterium]|nr:PDZ domain-containing protein [Candidatus Schekmanbacteria bacterium]
MSLAADVNNLIDQPACSSSFVVAQFIGQKEPDKSGNYIFERNLVSTVNPAALPVNSHINVFFGYLRLTGTTVLGLNHKKNKAVIKDLLTWRNKSYATDSEIPYGVRIICIDEKGVVLQKDGFQKQLKIGEETGDLENVVQLRSKGYKQVNENEWLIRPNNLIGKTENIFKFLTQASIQRCADTGQNRGFMVNEIEQGALFKELGIEDGDIITAINGKTIDSLAAAYEVYQQIRKAPTINLNLKRRQQDIDLAYYVVPSGIPKFSVENALKSPKVAELFK